MIARQPLQCLCIAHGAFRPRFVLPAPIREGRGLLPSVQVAFALHAVSGLNSSLKSTRDYWRAKFGMWPNGAGGEP